MNKTICFLFSIFLLGVVSNASADKAIFAGGCFWCMEADFEKLDGVKEVISGFSGGKIDNPTYKGNHQGHYEVIEVDYDADIVSYEKLLDYFWTHIDPFDPNGQFCDKGHSYLSAIFVANEEEKKLAQISREKIIKMFPEQKVITPILESSTFYPIKGDESYHQDYYKNNSVRYKYYRWSCGRDKRVQEIWGDSL